MRVYLRLIDQPPPAATPSIGRAITLTVKTWVDIVGKGTSSISQQVGRCHAWGPPGAAVHPRSIARQALLYSAPRPCCARSPAPCAPATSHAVLRRPCTAPCTAPAPLRTSPHRSNPVQPRPTPPRPALAWSGGGSEGWVGEMGVSPWLQPTHRGLFPLSLPTVSISLIPTGLVESSR